MSILQQGREAHAAERQRDLRNKLRGAKRVPHNLDELRSWSWDRRCTQRRRTLPRSDLHVLTFYCCLN